MIALCVMACAATYQAFSEQFYGDAGFLFQQDLAAARSVKITAEWFADHVSIVLNW